MKMCDVTLFDGGVKDAQGRLGDFASAMRPNPGPKAKLPGWSPTVFKDNRRSKERAQWTSAIVVDVDGGPWAALEAGLDAIDLGCVYHTTPSFTGAEARARVIYPLHTHITGEVALPLARWICATFTQADCKVDTAASCDLARFWFSPMVGPNFIHTWRPGDWLQPDDPRGIRSDIPERVEALDATRTPPTTAPLARPERGSMMLSLAKLRGHTQDGPTKSLVVCPWDSAHTSGFKLDGSTAVFPSTTASGIGGFRCLHNSCRQRTWKHVVEWHSEADLKNVGWDLQK